MSNSTSIKDGGPAFPHTRSNERFAYPNTEFSGMTLRDVFAAHALQGMLAKGAGTTWDMPQQDSAARAAYRYADAMLKERETNL